jgi:putative FmdB family regulatory protein
MPLYEYQCDACGHKFEKIQKFSDPLETICPKCGGVIRKLMSSPAIQFKGSGFYITDYAKKDHVASAKADKAEATKSDNAGKSEKSDKTEKSEQSQKSEKSDKSDSSSTKSETSSSSKSSADSGSSSAPASKSST